MSLVYPLLMPATPNFRTATLTGVAVTGLSADPFTGSQQVFEWPGSWWEFQGDLPLMRRGQAEQWLAFMLALRGQSQKFLLGDPLGRKSALGSLAGGGNVTLLTAGQTGKLLTVWGWTANQAGVLKAGDYFQLPRNYLLDPFNLSDNTSWVLNHSGATTNPTTSHTPVAPDGTSTADQISFPSTGAGQLSWIGQSATNPDPRGQPFVFRIWLKASSGSPAIQLQIDDGAGVSVATAPVTLSSSIWQVFTLAGTVGLTANAGALFASIRQVASQAAKTVFAWGAALYSPQLDARLYKVLADVASDSSQNATIDVFPRLRSADLAIPLLTTNPMGLFRLVTPRVPWTIDVAQTYGLTVAAIEAI